jgi:hypothetical protein
VGLINGKSVRRVRLPRELDEAIGKTARPTRTCTRRRSIRPWSMFSAAGAYVIPGPNGRNTTGHQPQESIPTGHQSPAHELTGNTGTRLASMQGVHTKPDHNMHVAEVEAVAALHRLLAAQACCPRWHPHQIQAVPPLRLFRHRRERLG